MSHVSEDVERAALEDLHAAATECARAEAGARGLRSGSAFVSIADRLPPTAIVINRTIGLGVHQAGTFENVAEIVRLYKSAGIQRYFVHVHPDAEPADIEVWLQSFGLQPARSWQKFSRGRETVPETTSDLTLREIGPADARAFAEIVCDAFDLGKPARPWLELLPGRDRWHVFMSFADGRPAGTGALFIDGEACWTDFGATAPEFRKRGSQSALLRHRVRFALDHGCKQLFTCTGKAVPGDPQHSYANILKCGFREEYVRRNFAPPAAPVHLR